MNQNVNAARDVTKTSAYRVQTFESVDLGMLGVADPDIVKFFTEPTRRHTTSPSSTSRRCRQTLPPVEMLYAYSDAPGYLVDALVEHGVRGIVIDGVGAGSLGSYDAAVESAQKKGVIAVATARTHGGRVQDTPRRHEAGVMPGDNLPPEKAEILLQLALDQDRATSTNSGAYSMSTEISKRSSLARPPARAWLSAESRGAPAPCRRRPGARSLPRVALFTTGGTIQSKGAAPPDAHGVQRGPRDARRADRRPAGARAASPTSRSRRSATSAAAA